MVLEDQDGWEEEEEEGDAEDWHWWQNLRFTLSMLRSALSRDELVRCAAVFKPILSSVL